MRRTDNAENSFAARLLSLALEVTSLEGATSSSHCSLVTINDGIEPNARLWVCILLCKLRSGINRMNKYPP